MGTLTDEFHPPFSSSRFRALHALAAPSPDSSCAYTRTGDRWQGPFLKLENLKVGSHNFSRIYSLNTRYVHSTPAIQPLSVSPCGDRRAGRAGPGLADDAARFTESCHVIAAAAPRGSSRSPPARSYTQHAMARAREPFSDGAARIPHSHRLFSLPTHSERTRPVYTTTTTTKKKTKTTTKKPHGIISAFESVE